MIKRLKELAEKATPGPWRNEDHRDNGDWRSCGLIWGGETMPDYFPGEKICQVIEDKLHSESGSKMIERFEANSAFIALVNPDTILKLISVIEESREALSIGQELVSELENEDVDITDIQQHTNEIYELVTVLTKINEILGESE